MRAAHSPAYSWLSTGNAASPASEGWRGRDRRMLQLLHFSPHAISGQALSEATQPLGDSS